MNETSYKLQFFLLGPVSPWSLAGKELTDEDFANWKNYILKETAELKLFVQSRLPATKKKAGREISALLLQITSLCSTVNGYITRNWESWHKHPRATEIRANYLFTCTVLEGLLAFAGELFPNESADIPVSNFRRPQTGMQLKVRLNLAANHMGRHAIDHVLSDLVINGLRQMIRKEKLTNSEASYIGNLLTSILNFVELDTAKLIGLLVLNDFNVPEFFLYYVTLVEKKLDDVEDMRGRQRLLLEQKRELSAIFNKSGKPFLKSGSTVYRDLKGFLDETYQFTVMLLRMQQETAMDTDKIKKGARFQINLPVPQFGLFIRMQLERGILVKENLGDLFSFFAAHFYTAKAPFISPDSLLKKSTDVEFSTAQKMKAQLIGMLNWLNSNYNLSNYNT